MRRNKTGGQTEAQFLRAVIEYAQLHKWRVFHARPARTAKGWRTPVQGDGVGFVDLVLARNKRVIFAELKIEKASLTETQRAWCFELPDAQVWRPIDWPLIEETLK